jgi:hypothetical protein
LVALRLLHRFSGSITEPLFGDPLLTPLLPSEIDAWIDFR